LADYTRKSCYELHSGILALMKEISIYLHIPFCRHRCAYCDFNTYAGIESHIPAYIQAICLEIRYSGNTAGSRLPAHTVFFGGGTPSLLPDTYIRQIIDEIGEHYVLLDDAEITLEANPGTLTPGYLRSIRRCGINRLSLGMQSVRPFELKQLERQHDMLDVIQSVKWARDAGFDNLNIDLIFGLPDQTLENWQDSLVQAVNLNPEHLAIYSLILEDGTSMKRWVDRGLINMPDEDIAADIYEWTSDYLAGLGYVHYEISNWARYDGDRNLICCRHNLQYWRMKPYLGFGAGAHGFIDGVHTSNIASPFDYVNAFSDQHVGNDHANYPVTPATAGIETVTRRTEMGEVMLMGLRLVEEGVSLQEFKNRFGVSIWDMYRREIEGLQKRGLVEVVEDQGERIRLTADGRLLGNQVFVEFVD
jgi:oxygen-independent coproporphyrinogen-3 oxidase